jgi:SOS-response transcriptional repressor LexA/transcriptional regulator with XRE-family HTH domain
VNQSQRNVDKGDASSFGGRLREAFVGVSNKEIAERLGVSKSAVTNYVEGRIPSADMLAKISELTSYSIHWLITGEGSKLVSQKTEADLDKGEAERRRYAKDLLKRVLEVSGSLQPAALADSLHIEPRKLYEWHEGKEVPDYMDLALWSQTVNVSLRWLITGEGAKGPSELQEDNAAEGMRLFEEMSLYYGPKISLGKGAEYIPVYLRKTPSEILENLAMTSGQSLGDVIENLALVTLINKGLVRARPEGVDVVFYRNHVPKFSPVRIMGEIAANKPIQYYKEGETILVHKDFVVRGRENFVLRALNDTLKDIGIYKNDLIICVEPKEDMNGEVVVALVSDNVAIGKLYQQNRHIALISVNPLHKDIGGTLDNIKIQGIILGVQRQT